MRYLKFVTVFLCCVCSCAISYAEEEITFVKNDQLGKKSGEINSRQLFSVNLQKGTVELFHESKDKFLIEDVKVASGNQYVLIDLCLYTDPSAYRIELLDSHGNSLQKIEGAGPGISWSPSYNAFAYTTGKPSEIGFKSTGTWIYDLTTKTSTKVCDEGYYLNWAKFDGNLYIEQGKEGGDVVVYNVAKKCIEKTPYYSSNFSEDGKYYHAFDIGELWPLFIRETNEDITDRYEVLKQNLLTEPPVWLNSHTLLCTYKGEKRCDYLIDLDTGETREIAGSVLGLSKDGQDIYVSKEAMKVEKQSKSEQKIAFPGKGPNKER